MENKGIAFIVMAFIGIIVGLAFWPSISPNVGQMTNTYTSLNTTITLPAAGATIEIPSCGQRVVTSLGLVNATNWSSVVPTSNYTISQSVGTDGYLAAKITTASQSAFASRSVNVSCVYEPKGYIAESSSRAMVGLVVIALALLIFVAAIPDLRNGLMDFIKK